jgi:Asp-tRNA(Asn)/Glu-tRNA(Gln) amidotransferase B subunit
VNNSPYFDYCGIIAKILIQLVNPALKDSEQRDWYFLSQTYLAPFITGNDLGALAKPSADNKYPWAYVKKIVDMHIDLNQYWPCISYTDLMSLYPCDTLSDDGALNIICDKILANNPDSIKDYKKGKLNALNHLKGQVMKETKGKADIQKVELLLKSKMISIP